MSFPGAAPTVGCLRPIPQKFHYLNDPAEPHRSECHLPVGLVV